MALATALHETSASHAAAARFARQALTRPALDWTPEIERETAAIYARVQHVIPPVEWPFQRMSFTSVFVATYLPRYSSGKKITRSTPRLSTTCTAFDEVQQISVSAFTSADEFT